MRADDELSLLRRRSFTCKADTGVEAVGFGSLNHEAERAGQVGIAIRSLCWDRQKEMPVDSRGWPCQVRDAIRWCSSFPPSATWSLTFVYDKDGLHGLDHPSAPLGRVSALSAMTVQFE